MGRLRVLASGRSPVAEASGLCVVVRDGVECLAVVGDQEPVLAVAALPATGLPEQWDTVELSGLAGAPAGLRQVEAVEPVGPDRVIVVCEEPSLAVVVDLVRREVLAHWRMMLRGAGWNEDPNSRAESVIPGPAGHLWVVKEKNPVAVIEVGPPGDLPSGGPPPRAPQPWQIPTDLVELGWQELATDAADISDAAWAGDAIWLLSDQDRCLLPVLPGAADWAVGDAVRLPKGIDKPEGLAVSGTGRWFVACDLKGDEPALFEIEPPIS